MTDFGSAGEILARISVDPGQLGPLPDALSWLNRAGLPTKRTTFHQAQMRGDGCPRFIYANRSIYRAGDVLEWALRRARRAEDGGQRGSAQTRRARGDRLGRPPRGEHEALAA
jgi:hypothetical protein